MPGRKAMVTPQQRHMAELLFEGKMDAVQCYVIAYRDGVYPDMQKSSLVSLASTASNSAGVRHLLKEMSDFATLEAIRRGTWSREKATMECLEYRDIAKMLMTEIKQAVQEYQSSPHKEPKTLSRLLLQFNTAMQNMDIYQTKLNKIWGLENDNKTTQNNIAIQTVYVESMKALPQDENI